MSTLRHKHRYHFSNLQGHRVSTFFKFILSPSWGCTCDVSTALLRRNRSKRLFPYPHPTPALSCPSSPTPPTLHKNKTKQTHKHTKNQGMVLPLQITQTIIIGPRSLLAFLENTCCTRSRYVGELESVVRATCQCAVPIRGRAPPFVGTARENRPALQHVMSYRTQCVMTTRGMGPVS